MGPEFFFPSNFFLTRLEKISRPSKTTKVSFLDDRASQTLNASRAAIFSEPNVTT